MKKTISFPLLLFIFITIFEPPFLPVPFIYVQGLIEVLFLIIFKFVREKRIDLTIMNRSGMSHYMGFIIILWLWILVARIVDVLFFNGMDSMSNFLRSTNQLLVLTFIQFLNIGIIISCFRKCKNPISRIFDYVVYAGVFQGVLAILAYLIPIVRTMFLKFGGSVYSNEWLLQRRGYGFSLSLLDGFGYGMGLIAALVIFRFKKDGIKNNIIRCLQLALIVTSISLNSRTGFVIIAVAILAKLLLSTKVRIMLLKIPLTLIAVFVMYKVLIWLINKGLSSQNITVKWISTDIGALLKSVFPAIGINVSASSSYSNNDNPYYSLLTDIELPHTPFQYLFGEGWQVYYGSQYGYRSDNGYINMAWMFGILGTIYYYVYNTFVNFRLLSKFDGKYYHILIFNVLALFIYSAKGRPFGYYPGIVIFYLIIFSIMFFSNTNNSNKEKNDKI